MDPFGVEKGVAIRMPSTANLMISSYDRVNPTTTTSGQFTITQPQSLLNGFFTRIATTEVALNWNVENISTSNLNTTIIVDVSGIGNQTFFLPSGCYTCADILDTFVSLFNAGSGGGRTLAVTSTGQIVTLTMTGGAFRFPAVAGQNIIGDLGFSLGGNYGTTRTAETSPLAGVGPSEQVQQIIYLDFVCSQLTYNQLLKDASTDKNDRDVLCRWYMNYDNDMNQVDKYGYALRMGMKPFYVRRTFSPPKQIRWSGSQPLGQLIFEVYATSYDAQTASYTSSLLDDPNFHWLMTLQVSEV